VVQLDLPQGGSARLDAVCCRIFVGAVGLLRAPFPFSNPYLCALRLVVRVEITNSGESTT
jgi:hypothetical protein